MANRLLETEKLEVVVLRLEGQTLNSHQWAEQRRPIEGWDNEAGRQAKLRYETTVGEWCII